MAGPPAAAGLLSRDERDRVLVLLREPSFGCLRRSSSPPGYADRIEARAHSGRLSHYRGYVQTREVRELRIDLPEFGSGGLEPVSAPWSGDLDRAHVKSGDGAGMRLHGAALRSCHLDGIDLAGVVWEDVTLVDCLIERVDLSGAELTGLTFERCHLLGCRLTYAHLTESRLDHVIFEDCRLDQVRFDEVDTNGPTAFVGSVLVDATLRDCAIRDAAFAGCRLRQVTFTACDLRGTDVRGNRLADISGISSFRGVVIEAAQQNDLIQALKRELQIGVRGPAS
jgi:uncharacterized protein YjbI with pentapeptide repeats